MNNQSLRQRTARSLRKVADLIDPFVAPSTEALTVRIAIDASEADQAIERLHERCLGLRQCVAETLSGAVDGRLPRRGSEVAWDDGPPCG
ncbi:MAG: hypothetical protein JWN34_33 [Bryobacterales bacterium]|nr:hypothetical protein [Bryobacterales bacterium]